MPASGHVFSGRYGDPGHLPAIKHGRNVKAAEAMGASAAFLLQVRTRTSGSPLFWRGAGGEVLASGEAVKMLRQAQHDQKANQTAAQRFRSTASGFRRPVNRFRSTNPSLSSLANGFATPVNRFASLANRFARLANGFATPANRFATLANRSATINLAT